MLHADSAHRIAALLLADEIADIGAPLAGPTHRRSVEILALFLLGALHAARDTGSLATSAPVPPRWTNPAQQDPTKRVHGMAHTNTLTKAAAAAALSIGSLASAQEAVQWRVEDGGNGHWYARNHAGLTWAAAHSAAVLMGGGLATTTSAGELAFIRTTLLQDGFPCWLGGTIDCSAVGEVCCTGCVWRWTSGEPFDVSWTGWIGDNAYTTERLVTNGVGFDDMCSPCSVQDYRPPSIVEWSADCNNDGLVDFGQIRAGELDDANGNNIPDCCEGGASCNCPGDVIPDGVVDGVDLAAVLGQWGSAGDKSFSADANGDGTVDAGDLSIVLNGWGACP